MGGIVSLPFQLRLGPKPTMRLAQASRCSSFAKVTAIEHRPSRPSWPSPASRDLARAAVADMAKVPGTEPTFALPRRREEQLSKFMPSYHMRGQHVGRIIHEESGRERLRAIAHSVGQKEVGHLSQLLNFPRSTSVQETARSFPSTRSRQLDNGLAGQPAKSAPPQPD